MKVLFVCPDFNKLNIRKQPWRYAYEIAKHMCEDGLEIRILTNSSGEFDSDFMIKGIDVHILNQATIRFPTKELIASIIASRADVVLWFGNALSGLYIRHYKGLNMPFVLYVSQSPFSIKELSRLSLRELWDYRFDLLSAFVPRNGIIRLLNSEPIKSIIVSSHAIGYRLISLGVAPDKVHFAPLAFHHWTLAPRPNINKKDWLGLRKNPFVITYFGGSPSIRGTDTLVKVAMVLKNMGVTNFLVLFLLRRETKHADKWELYLRRITKKYRVESHVCFISKMLSKEELITYLYVSDLIVLPFKIVPSEPPISVLEALSMGKTVVTTKVNGLSELVTINRGALVKPSDFKGLAKVIRALMDSPETRDKLSCQAKDFVSQLEGFDDLTKWTILQLSEAINS